MSTFSSKLNQYSPYLATVAISACLASRRSIIFLGSSPHAIALNAAVGVGVDYFCKDKMEMTHRIALTVLCGILASKGLGKLSKKFDMSIQKSALTSTAQVFLYELLKHPFDPQDPYLPLDKADHSPTPDKKTRMEVLKNTVSILSEEPERMRLHDLAKTNLERWKKEEKGPGTSGMRVFCIEEDTLNAAKAYTQEYGTTFAVLNMANAYTPGGGYRLGCAAQEENIFRRSDAHFTICNSEDKQIFDRHTGKYTSQMTDLINGKNGTVHLDEKKPLVCIKTSEIFSQASQTVSGYKRLGDNEIFEFYELRSAAIDLRQPYNKALTESRRKESTRSRIKAQLETLKQKGIRHVVLSAFGCGAFQNNANEVASIYNEELKNYKSDLDVVVFAIYYAGSGPNNFSNFEIELSDYLW